VNWVESIGNISENRSASVYGHWDAMAEIYRAWENYGTTRQSLEPFVSDILDPVLIVGTGAGAIQAQLSSMGMHVFGIDQSRKMLAVACKKRLQQAVCALGQQLPFKNDAFNTVVITTGVLETDPVSPRALIFDEVNRVLRVTGTLLVSTIFPSREFVRAGRELGLVVGNALEQGRHFEIWRAGNQKEGLINLVAKWRRMNRPDATRMILKYRKLLKAIALGFEHLAQTASQKGLNPEKYLNRCTRYTIKSWNIGKYQKLLDRYDRRIVRLHEEPEKNVITFHATIK